MAAAKVESCQPSTEKIEKSAKDDQVDPILSDYLSDLVEKDDSKNIVDEKCDLDSVETKSKENECVDQTDFTQTLSSPANPNSSDVLLTCQDEDNLKGEPSVETEQLQKTDQVEDSNIQADEANNCAKETDINEISDDTSIVQQEIEEKNISEPEEIQASNQTETVEAHESCQAEEVLEEPSSRNDDEKSISEKSPLIDESKVMDEIPTTVVLEKEENMEQNNSTDVQNESTLTSQNLNEDENKNDVVPECDMLMSDSEISENVETADSIEVEKKVQCLENDIVAEENLKIEDKIENIEEPEDVELSKDVGNQELEESTLNLDIERDNIQTTGTASQEPVNENVEMEMPMALEKIEDPISQIDVVGKEDKTILSENEIQQDNKSSLEQAESNSLVKQGISEDTVTLKDSVSEGIIKPTSMEVKEISEQNEISNETQEIIESSSSEQDLGSQDQEIISNMMNEVDKDLDSDLNKLLETKESVSEKVSHFDNSKMLTSSDQNFQLLEEKSQDTLSVLDTVANSMENEKLSPAGKADDITFGETSQSPVPMHSDKFISDLYNSCMPDDTSQFSNAEMENIKGSAHMRKEKPSLEVENEELMETDALENDTELMFEETQADKDIDEPSAEISELESAVKFLQESEQSTESSHVMTANEGNSNIFISVEDGECDNASEVASNLPETMLDPIAISEAEIITEAAKLETERKQKLELEKLKSESKKASNSQDDDEEIKLSTLSSTENVSAGIESTSTSSDASGTSTQDILQVTWLSM